jgi:hypothetical protein
VPELVLYSNDLMRLFHGGLNPFPRQPFAALRLLKLLARGLTSFCYENRDARSNCFLSGRGVGGSLASERGIYLECGGNGFGRGIRAGGKSKSIEPARSHSAKSNRPAGSANPAQ